jgi:Rps23 Pro-64 3,4-dihydroxylase Tpa1-like proline 4-hydroxylase
MGLAERRIAKDFQENEFVDFLNQIKETTGKEIDVQVEWDTLCIDGMSHLYKKSWPQVYFIPLVDALKAICEDEMGKEVIAEELQKIIIKNEAGVSSATYWSSFDNKTITLDHKPTTNVHHIEDRAKQLQKALENGL